MTSSSGLRRRGAEPLPTNAFDQPTDERGKDSTLRNGIWGGGQPGFAASVVFMHAERGNCGASGDSPIHRVTPARPQLGEAAGL